MKPADRPFQFMTASYVTRIGTLRAASLNELGEALARCSDESIFFHTFHALGGQHLLTDGFPSDFAHWVAAATHQDELAEQLAGLDVRHYHSLPLLRKDLRTRVTSYCERCRDAAGQTATEPFHFCESVEVALPLGRRARTLEEFRDALAGLSCASLHGHFISSRLRFRLRTNDFSRWLSASLGLEELAARVHCIDIYTSSLDGVRDRLLALIDSELHR